MNLWWTVLKVMELMKELQKKRWLMRSIVTLGIITFQKRRTPKMKFPTKIKLLVDAYNLCLNTGGRDFLSTAVGLQKHGKHCLSTEFWVRVLSYRKLSDAEIAECNLNYNSNREILLEIHRSRCSVKESINSVRSVKNGNERI